MKYRSYVVLILLLLVVAGLQSYAQSIMPTNAQGVDLTQQRWNGDSICYSGYRGGENPDLEVFPSEQEILQDLTILSRHWKLLRVYGADPHGERVLKVVREHHLPMKVMLGIWLTGAQGHESSNEKQLSSGIALAQQYPDVVAAVSLANEALVSWSDHRMTEEQVISAVQRVRKAVHIPVTVADDYLYWINPEAALVKHVDFITLHTYPVWGKEDIDTGFSSTVANYEKVRRAHPGKTIVLGEVGWPTFTAGERHALHAGDEQKQRQYFKQISDWARTNQVTALIFEAFDEPWKGTGTEGHWGLFSEQRKAKPAVLELYPELKPATPTSPSYDDVAPKGAK